MPPLDGPRPLHFVRAPAFWSALAFAAGIPLSRVMYRQPALLLIAAALGFAAVLVCPRARAWLRIAALLLAWTASGFLAAELSSPLLISPQARAAAYDDADHSFTLHVTAVQAERALEGWSGSQLHLRTIAGEIQALDGARLNDGAQVTLESSHGEPLPAINCGDTFSARAHLRVPETYRTPGAWSPSDTLGLQGIVLIATVHRSEIVGTVPGKAGWQCRVATLRARVLERLTQVAGRTQHYPAALQLTGQDTAVLAAALLGDRTLLTPDIRSSFQRTGTYHLLIVSGLSIAVLAGFLYVCLIQLRLPRWTATLITLAVVSAYALFAGFGAPVRRALLMTAVFMLGRLLYRRLEAMNSLGAAALLLLAITPAALFNPGFQMTMLAVFAIAGIVAPLLSRAVRPASGAAASLWTTPNDPGLPPRLAQFRVMLRVWSEALRPLVGRWAATRLPVWIARVALLAAEILFVSLALELCLAPMMAVYFHRFTALSILANGITLLWLTLLLPLGFLALLVALVSVHVAAIVAAPLALLLHLAQASILHLASLRVSEWRVPPTRPLALGVLALAFCAAMLFARMRGTPAVAATVACLGAIGALAFWPVPFMHARGALEITALDVGQGDSLLVVTPEGKTLLIDSGGPAGPSLNANFGDRIGEDVVSNYLWSRGIRRLDTVALTHAHSDHMGGMPVVLRNFRPRELWVGANPPVASYQALLAEASQLGVQVQRLRAGADFAFGGADLRVLSPAAAYQPGSEPSNEDSLVLAAGYQGTAALLEGDAQKHSEEAMLAAGVPHVALLKVGHHGSLSSTTPRFLAAASPQDAVISSGRYNPYKHPRRPILERLEDAHVRTWRTDTEGATTFLLDRDGVHAQRP